MGGMPLPGLIERSGGKAKYDMRGDFTRPLRFTRSSGSMFGSLESDSAGHEAAEFYTESCK